MIREFSLSTPRQTALIDITNRIAAIVRESSVKEGFCIVYIPHTTAAITINENADPSVRDDIVRSLGTIVPEDLPYSHMEGNSPAHLKASLIGSSETILIDKGVLALGTWQGIYFCEFDGPRKRKVIVKTMKG